MEFMMGGTILFGGTFAPKDWAFCDGQLIAISQNQALYAILGTTWGGDGRTNFALPDLRGRAPIGAGNGIGLTDINAGRQKGSEINTLHLSQMPAHTHSATFTGTGGGSSGTSAVVDAKLKVSTENANSPVPSAGDYLAKVVTGGSGPDKDENIYRAASSGVDETKLVALAEGSLDISVDVQGGNGITGGTVTVNPTGNDAAFSIMQPVLGMNYIIALEGTFPSRN
ncbi:phage tail protein [Algibacillus agarilyticus]|uniref:phage tail protein n=1 Tax=Algibacillus agarilyticus TaxID=2234133 RepID=UPI000DCFD823|nr:tail fiber protein [Algibacillus agarilyticus]